jgi:hypothetical protein
MEKLFSAVDGNLNHIIFEFSDLSQMSDNRVNLCPDEAFLQLGVIKTGPRSYSPHFHLDHPTPRPIVRAHESWVVIRGRVEVTLFDIDNKVQAVRTLQQGDVTLTLQGGHGYRVLEDDSFIYEYKSGPYLGPSVDKQQIE